MFILTSPCFPLCPGLWSSLELPPPGGRREADLGEACVWQLGPLRTGGVGTRGGLPSPLSLPAFFVAPGSPPTQQRGQPMPDGTVPLASQFRLYSPRETAKL